MSKLGARIVAVLVLCVAVPVYVGIKLAIEWEKKGRRT